MSEQPKPLIKFSQDPNIRSVKISGPSARDVAYAAAKKHSMDSRIGGKKRKVKKSVKTKKFK